jgi:hypothetical protein
MRQPGDLNEMKDIGVIAAFATIGFFVLIILWGKTPGGKRLLAERLGEPGGVKKARRRSSSASAPAASSSRTKRTSSSPKKPASKAAGKPKR